MIKSEKRINGIKDTKEMREKAQKSGERESHIPQFATVEEEAAFWDTHSIEDFADELELVTDVKFVRARHTRAITVRLGEEAYAALSKTARRV